MTPTFSIQIKRVYDQPHENDGLRVLVDRLWPRGLKKTEARIDAWAKELAPSSPLRKWYAHQPPKFGEFRRRYLEELKFRQDSAHRLLEQADGRTLTLLFAARNADYSHAIILRDFLLENFP